MLERLSALSALMGIPDIGAENSNYSLYSPPRYSPDTVMGDESEYSAPMPGGLMGIPDIGAENSNYSFAPRSSYNEFLPPDLSASATAQMSVPMTAPFQVPGQVAQGPQDPNWPLTSPVQSSGVRRVQAPAPGQAPAPVAAGAGGSLWDQVGRSREADLALALALGGFGMAAAAGQPGATPLSALGKGGQLGIASVMDARKAARAEDQAKELMGIKKAAAAAALLKAQTEKDPEKIKLMKYREELRTKNPNDPRIAELDAILDKMGKFAPSADKNQELTRLQEKRRELMADPLGNKREINEINARIKKLGDTPQSEAAAIIEALQKGQSEYEKSFGKEMGKADAEVLTSASTASDNMSVLDELETSLATQTYTGGWTGPLNEFKANVESVLHELNIQMPEQWKADSAKQTAESLSNELATLLIKRMGARPSDRDMAILMSTLPSLRLTKEANQQIIDRIREGMLYNIEKGMRLMNDRAASGGASASLQARSEQQNEVYQHEMEKYLSRPPEVRAAYSPRLKAMLKRYIQGLRK